MGFGITGGSHPKQERGCGMLRAAGLSFPVWFGLYWFYWDFTGIFWLPSGAVWLENTASLDFSRCWWHPLAPVFAKLHRNTPHPLLIPVFLKWRPLLLPKLMGRNCFGFFCFSCVFCFVLGFFESKGKVWGEFHLHPSLPGSGISVHWIFGASKNHKVIKFLRGWSRAGENVRWERVKIGKIPHQHPCLAGLGVWVGFSLLCGGEIVFLFYGKIKRKKKIGWKKGSKERKMVMKNKNKKRKK